MSVKTLLQLIDELVTEKTGQPLNYIQKTILEGSLKGKTYTDIAKDVHLSEGHISSTGADLWKFLSDVLGVDISKPTAKGILEKIEFYNNASWGGDFVSINKVQIYTDNNNSKPSKSEPKKNYISPIIDLDKAPKISHFYGRVDELSQLQQWLVNERCSLIAILGLNGIGKTLLSLKITEEIKENFDYIIYRSLEFSPSLEQLLTDVLTVFSQDIEIPQDINSKISLFIKYFQSDRCLLILDDLQELFDVNKVSGVYQKEYQDYALFFKKVINLEHKSTLIINSREKPLDMDNLEANTPQIQSLTLDGLESAAQEILNNNKLLDQDNWETLIITYQGNPQWLEIIASKIKAYFNCKVTDFLQYSPLALDESIKNSLAEQFQRLTPLEKQIIIAIAQESTPILLREIFKNLPEHSSELLNIIDSLKRRLFIKIQTEEEKTILQINPVLKNYLQILTINSKS